MSLISNDFALFLCLFDNDSVLNYFLLKVIGTKYFTSTGLPFCLHANVFMLVR